MKRNRLTNLLLLTSITLFTACSSKAPEASKPKLTTFDIMGIDVSGATCQQSIEDLPLARTYPMVEPFSPIRVQNQRASCETYPLRYNNRMSTIKDVEWSAKKLLGIKYVWGATGPYTYDCSGFTQKIFRDAGIKIPRVSRDQAKVGQYISFNNLKKGDMVFFDTHKKQTGKVTHVGIYLGYGNFIHASSAAKKIVIFNFNKKTFYKKRFLWGRRVIQDNRHIASL